MPGNRLQKGRKMDRSDPHPSLPERMESMSISSDLEASSHPAPPSQWDGLRRIVDRWIEESNRLDTL